MAPRQRKDPRLPTGLRERDGYYSWTSPADGCEYGLGRDRRHAIQEAIAANTHLATRKPSLVERIAGGAESWSSWCDDFEKILAERDSRPNTVRTRKSQMKRLRALFTPGATVKSITTKQCAEKVEELRDAGKHRTAQAFRAFLIDCFDRAIARGIRDDNPARTLDAVRVRVMRSRLTLEVFWKAYEATPLLWLKNAMLLALVSGQDRDSVGTAEFTAIRDEAWWNERTKTGARIILPLDLRLDCIGLSLGDVVKRCRSTGILSRHLIHQTQRAKGARLGKAIHLDMLSRRFRAAVMSLGIEWAEKQPPSFHEIRSLSGRLHKEQGDISPQELMGHKDPRTTAIYTDGRGEWVRVGVRK